MEKQIKVHTVHGPGAEIAIECKTKLDFQQVYRISYPAGFPASIIEYHILLDFQQVYRISYPAGLPAGI